MQKRITYWLWHGRQIVATVLGDPGLSENQVRTTALENHERMPLVDECEAPFERAAKIRRAEIRVYPLPCP